MNIIVMEDFQKINVFQELNHLNKLFIFKDGDVINVTMIYV